MIYNMPKFFELETGIRPTNDTSPYRYTIEPTPMRVNEYYIKIYCIWMNFIFMGLIPFCLLIVLNLLTVRSLIKASTAESQSKKNEVALAKVSLSIVFVFILCHSVKWIPNLYEHARLAKEDKREWPPWVESTTHISHFLFTFNSSVNFYIYCVKHFKLVSRLCSKSSDNQDAQTLATSMVAESKSRSLSNGNNVAKPLLSDTRTDVV